PTHDPEKRAPRRRRARRRRPRRWSAHVRDPRRRAARPPHVRRRDHRAPAGNRSNWNRVGSPAGLPRVSLPLPLRYSSSPVATLRALRPPVHRSYERIGEHMQFNVLKHYPPMIAIPWLERHQAIFPPPAPPKPKLPHFAAAVLCWGPWGILTGKKNKK